MTVFMSPGPIPHAPPDYGSGQLEPKPGISWLTCLEGYDFLVSLPDSAIRDKLLAELEGVLRALVYLRLKWLGITGELLHRARHPTGFWLLAVVEDPIWRTALRTSSTERGSIAVRPPSPSGWPRNGSGALAFLRDEVIRDRLQGVSAFIISPYETKQMRLILDDWTLRQAVLQLRPPWTFRHEALS